MLIGTYPKELKSYVHTKPYTQMFISALFTFLKFQKLEVTKNSSVGEQIDKRWHIQTMKDYSAMKRNAP